MQIVRNPAREQFIFNQIRASFAQSDIVRYNSIHLSDLLTPRQAYWKRKMPLPADDREIQYFVIGRGHEDVMHHITGMGKVDGRVWEGIHYSMDFFAPEFSEVDGRPLPIEHKTRRGYLAKEGEEKERYSNYLNQLVGYCACEQILVGELWVWSLMEKTDAYRSEPQLACYDVQFTPDELEEERKRLLHTRDILVAAIGADESINCPWLALPKCEEWMCRRTITTMVEPPRCITCGRDFATDYGIGQHKKGKKTSDHEVKLAVYSKTYEPKCKWYQWCLGTPGIAGNPGSVAGTPGTIAGNPGSVAGTPGTDAIPNVGKGEV